jgi:hypothetical protein
MTFLFPCGVAAELSSVNKAILYFDNLTRAKPRFLPFGDRMRAGGVLDARVFMIGRI